MIDQKLEHVTRKQAHITESCWHIRHWCFFRRQLFLAFFFFDGMMRACYRDGNSDHYHHLFSSFHCWWWLKKWLSVASLSWATFRLNLYCFVWELLQSGDFRWFNPLTIAGKLFFQNFFHFTLETRSCLIWSIKDICVGRHLHMEYGRIGIFRATIGKVCMMNGKIGG